MRSLGAMVAQTTHSLRNGCIDSQAKELRDGAELLVKRISTLKGCLPSCFGLTGKALLAAANEMHTLPGMRGY